MNKRRILRISIVVMTILLSIILPKPVHADGIFKSVKYSKKMNVSTYSGEYWMDISNKYPGSTILSVRSSNIKVLKPNSFYDATLYFNARKKGTVKLTIKVKKANGKIIKIKPTVNVYRFINPFKRLKVDDKKVKIRKKSYNLEYYYQAEFSTKKAIVSAKLKLKKGWKVKSVKAAIKYDNKKKDWIYKRFKLSKLRSLSWESGVNARLSCR